MKEEREREMDLFSSISHFIILSFSGSISLSGSVTLSLFLHFTISAPVRPSLEIFFCLFSISPPIVAFVYVLLPLTPTHVPALTLCLYI